MALPDGDVEGGGAVAVAGTGVGAGGEKSLDSARAPAPRRVVQRGVVGAVARVRIDPGIDKGVDGGDSLALNGGLIRSVRSAADAALGHNGAAKAALPVQPPPAPAAFTAAFESVPARHDGSGAFTLVLALSEPPGGLGWRTVRDHLFDVAGGAIERVRRIGMVRNQRWELTVSPQGDAAVTLTLRASASCTDAHAVCTADGRTLGGGATVTVADPATVATEQPGAAFTGAFANAPGEHDGASAFTLEFSLSEGGSQAHRLDRRHPRCGRPSLDLHLPVDTRQRRQRVGHRERDGVVLHAGHGRPGQGAQGEGGLHRRRRQCRVAHQRCDGRRRGRGHRGLQRARIRDPQANLDRHPDGMRASPSG